MWDNKLKHIFPVHNASYLINKFLKIINFINPCYTFKYSNIHNIYENLTSTLVILTSNTYYNSIQVSLHDTIA